MTRARHNSNTAYNQAAITHVPPLNLMPPALAKLTEEIRSLTTQQHEAITKVSELQHPDRMEAAKVADRAEHGRRVRAGAKGVTVKDAQEQLAQETTAAQNDLEGINAAITGAYDEFHTLRGECHDDPAPAAKARKLAQAAHAALDAFLKAYTEYDQHDMLRGWYYGHSYQPVRPPLVIDLITATRNGSEPHMTGVDINDLIANLKKELFNESDI